VIYTDIFVQRLPRMSVLNRGDLSNVKIWLILCSTLEMVQIGYKLVLFDSIIIINYY